MRSLSFFFAINLVFGLSARGIDLSAHLGGLAAGFVGAFVLASTASPKARPLVRALVVLRPWVQGCRSGGSTSFPTDAKRAPRAATPWTALQPPSGTGAGP